VEVAVPFRTSHPGGADPHVQTFGVSRRRVGRAPGNERPRRVWPPSRHWATGAHPQSPGIV